MASRDESDIAGRIGWIRDWVWLEAHPICESELHEGQLIPSSYVIALSGDGEHESAVWGACALCVQAIADELGVDVESGIIG